MHEYFGFTYDVEFDKDSDSGTIFFHEIKNAAGVKVDFHLSPYRILTEEEFKKLIKMYMHSFVGREPTPTVKGGQTTHSPWRGDTISAMYTLFKQTKAQERAKETAL